MDTQDLAVLGVGDDFDETIVLAQDASFAIRSEGELADAEVVAGGARLRFGEADAADAGLGISRPGDAVLVHRSHRFARDMGNRDHALGGGDVRQLRRTSDDIADRIDARFAGPLELIHFYKAP